MKNRLRGIALGLSIILLNSCTPDATDSTNIRTKGIFANYSLKILDNNTTNIRVSLHSGGINGSSLDLISPEGLFVKYNSKEDKLDRNDLVNDIYYTKNINVYKSDTDISIIFKRENEELNSTIKLIPKVEILSPKEKQTISSTDKLEITWIKSSNSNIDISIDTECNTANRDTKTFSKTKNSVDNGTYTFSLSSIYPGDFEKYSNCITKLKVTRYREANVNSKFDDGTIRVMNSKTIELNVI